MKNKTKSPRTLLIKNMRKTVHSALPPWLYSATILLIMLIVSLPPIIITRQTKEIFITKYSIALFFYFLTIAVLGYALLLTRIKKNFIDPFDELNNAMQKVAKGDFSVRLNHESHSKYPITYNMFNNFNIMTEELASLDETKDDFIATVSHEIKTPLAIINNYSRELSKASLTDDEQQAYIETIIAATERLSDLVSNILRLNKIENKKILATKLCYNLSRQLCDCSLQFESIWEKKDINFEFDVEDELMIVADSKTMEIVWNNLLSNAFKYTSKSGSVKLSSRKTDKAIEISIRDTGCGISPDDMTHIFEKFYQADSARLSEGNGLGLAIVKRIIELNGFEIYAESTVGEGSCFTVKINSL